MNEPTVPMGLPELWRVSAFRRAMDDGQGENSRFNALTLIRAFLWLQDRKLPTFLPAYLLRSRYQIELLKPLSIGPELYLPHPFGIVLTMGTRIGARCNLYGLVRMLQTPSGCSLLQ